MKSISLLELHQAFKEPKPKQLILDVRTRDEFAEGHIPGAKNIPIQEIPQHVDDLKLPSEIFVYCLAGGRAIRTCEFLESRGVKELFCYDDGGFPEWAEKGFEIE